ncbi:MAG: bifunctional 4-hydroxy-2-oxoglutarate aldolase/2-dehydro-3-deoxy-phosphogluconate aldolase [Treponema sp.]|nr:bifunctional 4-hydroxy-2-oxoglutarate aldolase/2-dehydro-3-deoxy-phosphogluconate aldolase [Treponema sp.]
MNDTLKKIGETGIVPVVVLNRASDAEALAESLIKGGLACAEVTFRTDAAEESIRAIAKKFPDMFVGAGTVLTTEQADRAVDAGAKFIVSPGLNPKVVEHCLKKNYPNAPGIMTPSELEIALGFGLDVVKFFPAENAGGLKMIKAISAPYTMMKFMPTGGINTTNVRDYLACDKILACGGSWMVKGDLINAGDFAKIEELTKEAAAIVKEIRG